MPIRAFVTATLADLTTATTGIIPQLETALNTGSMHTLRNNSTGFLAQSNIRTQQDIQRLYNQARYEAYLRVKDLDSTDPTNAALQAQWTNPWTEKVMFVEVIRPGPFVNAIFPPTP